MIFFISFALWGVHWLAWYRCFLFRWYCLSLNLRHCKATTIGQGLILLNEYGIFAQNSAFCVNHLQCYCISLEVTGVHYAIVQY